MTLDEIVRRRYGRSCLPSVRIQVEQLRLRLSAFADWQAQHRAQGWRIQTAEATSDDEQVHGSLYREPFPVTQDQRIILRGRIDRIDVHDDTGERMILDYKTGDGGKSPEAAHRQGGKNAKQWIDLQLPLYRYLIGAHESHDQVRLGYIILPKSVSQTGLVEAEWSADELEDADETARRVILSIWNNEFPKAEKPPAFSEAFAAICQDRIFGSE